MKSLKFIYQETQIHFLLQNEGEVMVNATDLAKAFGKETKDFLRNETTKAFINAFIETENATLNKENSPFISEKDVVFSRQKTGTFMRRELAVYFAMWLDPYFAVWVTKTIDQLIWGYFKEYKAAMLEELKAKNEKEIVKDRLLNAATREDVVKYFELEGVIKNAKAKKRKASNGQMSLFEQQLEEIDNSQKI
jgi:hypothetical protein